MPLFKGFPRPYGPNGSQAPMSGSSRTLAQAGLDNKVHYVRINNSNYGVSIPIIYGTNKIAPTILWFGDQSNISNTDPTGNTISINTVALLLGLCEGPIQGVLQQWQTGGPAGSAVAQRLGASAVNIRWLQFTGDYTDMTWSYLTTAHPIDALAYRGIAKLANSAYLLGPSRQFPQFNFEVQGLLPYSRSVYDAEPAAILEDLCTESHHGGAFLRSHLDISGSWLNWKAANIAAGLLISPILDTQRALAQIINTWLEITMAQAVWSDGLLKIQPFYDQAVTGNGITFIPNLTPVIPHSGPDDYVVQKAVEPISVVRALPADKFNEVRVEYVNRAHSYQVEVTFARSQADIDLYQRRVAQPRQYHDITTQLMASKVARMQLVRGLTVRNQYTFTLSQKYIWLDPLDIWPLTSAELGLTDYPVRVLSVELNTSEELIVTAEDLGVCNASGLTGGEQTGGATRIGVNPASLQSINVPKIFEPSSKITYGRLFIYFGVSGQGGDTNWGGADVYWSEDNATFTFLNAARTAAIEGELLADFSATSVGPLQLDLSESQGAIASLPNNLQGKTHNLAAIFNDDGTNLEIIAMDLVTAGTGNFQWNVTKMLRGLYGTSQTFYAAV